MRKQTLILTLALLVAFSSAPNVPQSWAQEGPPQVTPSGTQPAVPGRFRESEVTPENVAKNPGLAAWVAKHKRLAHFLKKHPGLAEKIAEHLGRPPTWPSILGLPNS
jgi:hypothetical protein